MLLLLPSVISPAVVFNGESEVGHEGNIADFSRLRQCFRLSDGFRGGVLRKAAGF